MFFLFSSLIIKKAYQLVFMVVPLVLQRLDFGNAILVGLPAYQYQLSRLRCFGPLH